MKIRVIPTKVHGAIDYVTAPALVAAPDVLRLNGGRASAATPRVVGATSALYSALTDYELGLRRMIPMRAHVALDGVSGALVALAPWIFGSARQGTRHWLPHALVGASEIALAVTTKTENRQRGVRRVWSAVRGVGPAVAALPPGRRAAVIALPLALAALAYAGRRRVWQGVALAAEGVEEVFDVIEDAADFVEDAAEDLADAARAKAGRGEDQDAES